MSNEEEEVEIKVGEKQQSCSNAHSAHLWKHKRTSRRFFSPALDRYTQVYSNFS